MDRRTRVRNSNNGDEPFGSRINDSEKHKHWQSQTDLMIKRDQQHGKPSKEKQEWIIVPLRHQLFQSTGGPEQFEEIVVRAKALHSKALVCICWTTLDQKEEEQQAEMVKV